MLDTECRTGLEPIETTFSFPPSYSQMGTYTWLLSEPCSHAPSPDEVMTAPFYPDPSQRIFGFCINGVRYVIKTELLLKLARERGGQTVEWCGDHDIGIGFREAFHSKFAWISGCRLFCILPQEERGPLKYLEIYDCSRASRAKNVKVVEGKREGPILSSIGSYELPWTASSEYETTLTGGHDTIVVCVVSGPTALSASPVY